MALSDRIRPNVEAAPWVIDEIKRLEEENSRLRSDAERLNWLEKHPLMTIDDAEDDGYLYGVIGMPGLRLRELIDGQRIWSRKI